MKPYQTEVEEELKRNLYNSLNEKDRRGFAGFEALRKTYDVIWGAELDEKFLKVLREHTAGDPMDKKVRYCQRIDAE